MSNPHFTFGHKEKIENRKWKIGIGDLKLQVCVDDMSGPAHFQDCARFGC